ncbi:MAG: 7TM domain-containing protein [bacterium]
MFSLISYVIQRGIPQETIVLILILPIIATVIAFVRQIIGWKAFGIYTPLISAFAFWAIGLKYGLIVFAVVLLTGILLRYLIKHLRLLYLPRIAIVLTGVALSIFILLFIVAVLGQNGLLKTSIFPILIIISLLEEFIGAQTKKGLKPAIVMSIETVFLSIICYYLIIWSWLQNILLNYPWLIFLTVIFNIALGKWTGLRLSEYFRFSQVIKHVGLSKKK